MSEENVTPEEENKLDIKGVSENEEVNTKEETKMDDSWYCTKCGEKNVGYFCCKCGAKKPEPFTAPKEEPKLQGQAISPSKPKNKIFTLPRVFTCVIAIVLGLSSGALGGWIVGNQLKQEISESTPNFSSEAEKDDNVDPGFLIPGTNDNDSEDSNSSEDNSSSVPFAKAAIGIYVTQDESVGYSGCTISGFSDGSNAESAGLKEGDIISAIDGTEMTSYSDIQNALATKDAGDVISVTVIRDGSSVTVKVELVNSGTAG